MLPGFCLPPSAGLLESGFVAGEAEMESTVVEAVCGPAVQVRRATVEVCGELEPQIAAVATDPGQREAGAIAIGGPEERFMGHEREGTPGVRRLEDHELRAVAPHLRRGREVRV